MSWCPDAAVGLVSRIHHDLGVEAPSPVPPPTFDILPSHLATSVLAWASVAASALSAGKPAHALSLDPARIDASYRSDRCLLIDGAAPQVWAPLSGFWQAADGWVRTHANYPHHAARLRAALALAADAGPRDLAAAVLSRAAADSVQKITRAGGLAVEVRNEDPSEDARLRKRPLLELTRLESDPERHVEAHAPVASAPLRGIRVLDLTRVIAGPVCTRTLALLGAEVLRVDPPHLRELEWQHLDTGHGKRSTVLDARSPAFASLLAAADVVVLGYRPAALNGLGLSPDALATRHPGLIVAQLSAWEDPDRRGFDSLVQAESGIAMRESPDGIRPGALPAQALDHSAGYLLAAAITRLVTRRQHEGGSWVVRTSLRRIAAELLGMPRATTMPDAQVDVNPAAHTANFDVAERHVTTVRSVLPGFELTAPRPWGADQPRW